MSGIDATFTAIGHLILIPYYLVVAINMAGKMAYDRGVVYASSSRQDAEAHAQQLAAKGIEVVVLKTDKTSVLERIKSGANNYAALQKRVGTGEFTNKNQKQLNAYQSNLMMAAYGYNEELPNDPRVLEGYREAYKEYKSGIETELRMPKNSLPLTLKEYVDLALDQEALLKYREDLLDKGYYVPSPATTVVASDSNETEAYGNLKGGRRSKRSTKRRRNGGKSARR